MGPVRFASLTLRAWAASAGVTTKRLVLVVALTLTAALMFAVAWVVEPGVVAWRTRAQTYTAAMRTCIAEMSQSAPDKAAWLCQREVRP